MGGDALLVLPRPITTDRLVLRPTRAEDVERAFEIRSDWDVARMLSRASFPPDREKMGRWFADHEREWKAGEAYRFAVERAGRLIGITDIGEIADGVGELGYWFEKASWGNGYASEAARAVVRFGFEEAGLLRIKAGHAIDNPASGRILTRTGFRPVDVVQRDSLSRGGIVTVRRYVLEATLRSA